MKRFRKYKYTFFVNAYRHITCIVSFLQYNKVSFKFLSYRGYSIKLLKSEIVLGKIILEIWFSRPTCLESFTNLISEGKGKSISISDKVKSFFNL